LRSVTGLFRVTISLVVESVALKIIKLGMDTRQVIARFEVERQALAMMDHPNIAKVHDAGTTETETGRPYFVMELVRGLHINKFCEEKQLDARARLALAEEQVRKLLAEGDAVAAQSTMIPLATERIRLAAGAGWLTAEQRDSAMRAWEDVVDAMHPPIVVVKKGSSWAYSDAEDPPPSVV
jgi:hypothetical protein